MTPALTFKHACRQQLKLLSRHDLAEFDEKLDAKARKDAYEQRLAVNVSGCQRIWRCYITRKRYMVSCRHYSVLHPTPLSRNHTLRNAVS